MNVRALVSSSFFLCAAFSPALAAENIDPSGNGSRYAWAENAGWINAEPAGNGGVGVEVRNFDVVGWMWGENTGWISLSCENTASCATVRYGVAHDGFGNLSGFAWSENAGWINFHPATTAGVRFSPATGRFTGFAWAENLGWISFSCLNTASCGRVPFELATGWTCTAAAPAQPIWLYASRIGEDVYLSWSAIADASRYDFIVGGLNCLRASNGSFELCTQECVADDLTANELVATGDPPDLVLSPASPPLGDGIWFLVRGVNCAGGGSYDAASAQQVASRDAGIGASAHSCP